MVQFFDAFFQIFRGFRGVFEIDHMIGAMFCGVLLLLFLVTFFISLVRGLR